MHDSVSYLSVTCECTSVGLFVGTVLPSISLIEVVYALKIRPTLYMTTTRHILLCVPGT